MDVRNEVVDLATPLADELGFELVDIDFVQAGSRWLVRIYLDRPGGIKLDDCARFSRRLGDLMEMNQTLPHAYTIEVSSPGIERRIRTEEHFRRYVEHRAKVELFEPVDGSRRAEGVIRDVEDGVVKLQLDDGSLWSVSIEGVRQARLVVDPWKGTQKEKRPSSPNRKRGKAKRIRQGG